MSSTVPALAVALWLALVAPLPAVGLARPALAVPLAVVALALAALVRRDQATSSRETELPDRGRVVPGAAAGARRAAAVARRDATAARWGGPAVLAVAAIFGALGALTAAEPVVLRRDPGSYALAGQWLGATGRLVVPDPLAAVGGPGPGVTAASPGFFAVGADLVPQFLVGAHLVSAAGWWLGGWTGVLLAPAVTGALALVAFGGLVARLVGSAWAPGAVAVLGLAAPVLLALRAPYSEPLAMLLLLGGLCLLVDAAAAGPSGPARARLALAGGAVLGLGTLVRVDALREVALAVPVLGWLALRQGRPGGRGAGGGADLLDRGEGGRGEGGRGGADLLDRGEGGRSAGPPVRAAAAGLAAGTAVGVAAALVHSRPYLASIAGSVLPLAAATALLAAGTAALAARSSRRPAGRRRDRRGPAPGRRRPAWRRPPLLRPALLRPPLLRPARLGPVLLAGALAALASRPLWLVARTDPDSPGARVVAGLQLRQGLPVDGARTYAEHSVAWLSWYVGIPLLALAALGAVLLTHRVLAGRDQAAAVPLAVLVGGTLLTLWRPAITPDHPWADRRFVPVALPAVVLLGTWSLARLRAARPRATLALAGGVVAVAVPVVLAAAPLLAARTETGELAAVRRACAALGAADVALLMDARAAREWPQALRAGCGVPAVVVTDRTPATVARLAARIRDRGGTPVLLAAEGPQAVRRLGAVAARRVVDLRTSEHVRLLTARPERTVPLRVQLWAGRLG